jgi:hypothetical protein
MRKHRCSCGRDMGPRQLWCTPCRTSLRRWIQMSDEERAASKERAGQRWMRVNTFSTKSNLVKFRRRRAA